MNILVGIYSPFAAWNIPAGHIDRLRHDFPQHTFTHARSEAEALAVAADADISFMSELRPEALARATHLRWIHSPAAGVGNMLFPAMIASSVAMSNSRGLSAGPIAEHVLALTLALFRKFPLAFRSQAARHWAQDAVLEPPALRTIRGARVLIVGLGGIGAACASRFAVLGADVVGLRRRPGQPPPEGVTRVATTAELHDLLPDADVVVVCAAQTQATRGLIGAPELARMHRDAILINVSRGRLVDERALADALADGRIGGAGLDVFEHEPLDPASPLWALPNVILTPHMAGFRPDHWDAVTALFAENLRRFESQQPILNPVDKTAGY